MAKLRQAFVVLLILFSRFHQGWFLPLTDMDGREPAETVVTDHEISVTSPQTEENPYLRDISLENDKPKPAPAEPYQNDIHVEHNPISQTYPSYAQVQGKSELSQMLPELFRFVESLMVIMYNTARSQRFERLTYNGPNGPSYSLDSDNGLLDRNLIEIQYLPNSIPEESAYHPFYKVEKVVPLSPDSLGMVGPADDRSLAGIPYENEDSALSSMKSMRPAKLLDRYCVFQGMAPMNQFDCYKYLVCLPSKFNRFQAFIAYCPDDKRFSRTYRRCVQPYLVPECYRSQLSPELRASKSVNYNRFKEPNGYISEGPGGSFQQQATFPEKRLDYPEEEQTLQSENTTQPRNDSLYREGHTVPHSYIDLKTIETMSKDDHKLMDGMNKEPVPEKGFKKANLTETTPFSPILTSNYGDVANGSYAINGTLITSTTPYSTDFTETF